VKQLFYSILYFIFRKALHNCYNYRGYNTSIVKKRAHLFTKEKD
jgi:hypothetical protein